MPRVEAVLWCGICYDDLFSYYKWSCVSPWMYCSGNWFNHQIQEHVSICYIYILSQKTYLYNYARCNYGFVIYRLVFPSVFVVYFTIGVTNICKSNSSNSTTFSIFKYYIYLSLICFVHKAKRGFNIVCWILTFAFIFNINISLCSSINCLIWSFTCIYMIEWNSTHHCSSTKSDFQLIRVQVSYKAHLVSVFKQYL